MFISSIRDRSIFGIRPIINDNTKTPEQILEAIFPERDATTLSYANDALYMFVSNLYGGITSIFLEALFYERHDLVDHILRNQHEFNSATPDFFNLFVDYDKRYIELVQNQVGDKAVEYLRATYPFFFPTAEAAEAEAVFAPSPSQAPAMTPAARAAAAGSATTALADLVTAIAGDPLAEGAEDGLAQIAALCSSIKGLLGSLPADPAE